MTTRVRSSIYGYPHIHIIGVLYFLHFSFWPRNDNNDFIDDQMYVHMLLKIKLRRDLGFTIGIRKLYFRYSESH